MAKKWIWILFVLTFISGIAAGFFFFTLTDDDDRNTKTSTTDEQRQKGFAFINPLLDCGVEFVELRPFKREVQTYVEGLRTKRQLSNVSVYFRQLNNGYWFGIDEKTMFVPASLMKVPLMIAALKNAETNPTFLQQQIPFTAPVTAEVEPNIQAEGLQVGTTYTVEDLIRRMIVYSDNNAAGLIIRSIDPRVLLKVYSDLNLEIPTTRDYAISIKDYTTFFRVLYNASYLSREMSEKALKIASEAVFDYGLVAGVAPGTVVSHKFGERNAGDGKQLHDCGIIYYPDSPYALCIMTRGDNFDTLEDVIKDISHMVFERVKQQTTLKSK